MNWLCSEWAWLTKSCYLKSEIDIGWTEVAIFVVYLRKYLQNWALDQCFWSVGKILITIVRLKGLALKKKIVKEFYIYIGQQPNFTSKNNIWLPKQSRVWCNKTQYVVSLKGFLNWSSNSENMGHTGEVNMSSEQLEMSESLLQYSSVRELIWL